MQHLTTAVLMAGIARAATCAQVCPVVFDGRVPSTATPADFDTANGGGWNPFNTGYVKGNDLAWSDIIVLPEVETPSLFDAGETPTVPLEVTLSDESIFQSQHGFRRAGLQFAADKNQGSEGSSGVKTLHFSILMDDSRPLNYSHEYLMVWHEAADYSSNQFNFEVGNLIGREEGDGKSFKLLNRREQKLWETDVLFGVWNNFAITLDFEENTIAASYSSGSDALASVLEPTPNDNSGDGQYQIGMLKKPTGTDDVVNSGYQESGIDEGTIYGGIFLEDSSGGCVSTQAQKRRLRSKIRRTL